jgi:hypothetical protein
MVQRIRWQMGLVETLSRNLDLCFNPKHGLLGLVAIPYFWFVEVISPLLEVSALIIIPFALIEGLIQPSLVCLYFASGVLYNLMITLFGTLVDNRHISKFKNWSSPTTALQTVCLHFGYKQLTSWWRLLALFKMLKKNYHWGEKPRQEIIHQAF